MRLQFLCIGLLVALCSISAAAYPGTSPGKGVLFTEASLHTDSLVPPQNLAVKAGLFGCAVLHWDTVAGALGYKIYKDADELGFRPIGMTHTREFVDYYVFRGHEYRYFVTALTMMSESGSSNTVTFEPGVEPPPLVHGVIRGQVTDALNGHPLQDATVHFYKRGDLWNTETHTDTGGYYWKALDTGSYYIRADAFTHIGEWFDNAMRPDSATLVSLHVDTLTADFALHRLPLPHPVTVTGVVTDSITGQPLRNAIVTFIRPHRLLREIQFITGFFGGFPLERLFLPGLGEFPGVVWLGLTDSSGMYSAHLLSDLPYIVFASKPGFIPKFYDNKPTPQEADRLFFTSDTSGVNFALMSHPPAAIYQISGMVTDSTGNGVPSFVTLFRKTVFGRLPVRFCMTDSTGAFNFFHVAPGRFFLKTIPVEGFAPAWYSASDCGVRYWRNADSIDVTNTDVTGIDVCVAPAPSGGFARIAGQITHGPNASGKASTAAVQGVRGVTVYAISSATGQVTGYDVTEPDGSYMLENLPAGTYHLVTDKEGYVASTSSDYTVNVDNGYEVTNNQIVITPEPTLGVAEAARVIPKEFKLSQNYPNPFNPATQISYAIAKSSFVVVKIYNLIGQEVVTLTNGMLVAGTYTVRWNGADLYGHPASSGVYFVRLVANPVDQHVAAYTEVRKMILMK